MATREAPFGRSESRASASPPEGFSVWEEARTNPDSPKLGLPSEYLSQERFPARLSTGDLTVLAAMLILYVTNISVITSAGAAALPYWLLGFLTFLIPSAIVTGKLARMFPGEGACYVWVNKALGPFWGSLLGFFCLWWPPVLLIIAAGAAVGDFLQSIGASFGQVWLAEPWQQGVVVLIVVVIAWVIARLPLSTSRTIIRTTCAAYLGLLGLMGLFAVVLVVFTHHPSQTDFTKAPFDLNRSNITFYSTVILACLGIQLPLNMAGEVQKRGQISHYLSRTVLVVVFGYLLVWFAMATVLPQDPTSPLYAGDPGNIGQIFAVALGGSAPGRLISALASLLLCAFYTVSSGAYSIVQGRLLVMASLDRRLPVRLGHLDQHGVPRTANTVQLLILVPITLLIFVLAPLLSAQGANFETMVYALISASGVVIWAISALALFVVGAVLVALYPPLARAVGGPAPALVTLCGVMGTLATLGCIWLVFTGPWTPLLAWRDWFFWVALLVLGSLAVGAVYSFLAPEPADIWAMLARSHRPPRDQV